MTEPKTIGVGHASAREGRAMVIEVGATEARTNLSKLLSHVARGDRALIMRRGTPVAVVMSLEDLQKVNVADVIRRLRELRAGAFRGPQSLKELREDGRKR